MQRMLGVKKSFWKILMTLCSKGEWITLIGQCKNVIGINHVEIRYRFASILSMTRPTCDETCINLFFLLFYSKRRRLTLPSLLLSVNLKDRSSPTQRVVAIVSSLPLNTVIYVILNHRAKITLII